jgi:hypothetical protein
MLLPLFLALTIAQNTPACSGPAPAILSARVANAARDNGHEHYTVNVTVANVGGRGQADSVLQSVAVYRDGEKKDQKGIPPLRAGQSYHYTYGMDRAFSAAGGSTHLTFRLMGPEADCNANVVYRMNL